MKKGLLIVGAFAIVLATVPMFAAFEAHIINVTAQIENALSVTPDEIMFGTVFPQEKLYSNILIAMSQSFLDEPRTDDINYVIKQKPKVREQYDPYDLVPGTDMTYHEYCLNEAPIDPADVGNPENSYYEICYPNLCGQLSKHPDLLRDNGGNDDNLDSPHDPNIVVNGRLAKSEDDTEDGWVIDLVVPGFKGMVDQQYTEAVYGPLLDPRMEHETFGCDLWIEITGISRMIPLYEETGDDSTTLGPIKGEITYDGESTGVVAGTATVDVAYLDPSHEYLLVLNGPRNASVADGSTNELLATTACSASLSGYGSGWDGWWSNTTDNTGVTDTNCNGIYDLGDGGAGPFDDSPLTKLEGAYNFVVVSAAQLEAGYDFSLALPAGVYSEVQFLVKDLSDGWATVLEYPGVGETDSSPSTFSFTVNP